MFYRRQCRLRPLEYAPNVLLAEEHVLPCANLPTTKKGLTTMMDYLTWELFSNMDFQR